ncbi:MAG TPA: hypothetical protein VJR94_02445 [Candidatus Nitrosocosmicus sp.]|nr:hypothetical protein [Candidatus Nitrosocosmicus sp.]
MTNFNSEINSNTNRRIVLTEKEVSEISILYDTALRLSETISHPHNDQAVHNHATSHLTSDSEHDSSASVLKRKKAWHDVQEYLEVLGKKYNYDPEKFVINKITRELEPYKPPRD